MSLDRILGTIGVLLSLPGFLLLFFSNQETVAILVLMAGFIMLFASIAIYYFTNLPEYSMRTVEVTLEIKDAQGKEAELEKSYEFLPNYSHLDRMLHRNIAADGTVKNICWDGAPVQVKDIRQVLGEYEVTVHFSAPLPRWKAVNGRLSYEVNDSFPNSTEALHYVVDFPTRVLRIRIKLPAARPGKNPRATRNSGGKKPLRAPLITDGGRTIEYIVKRPLRGAEYSIYWNW